MFSAIFLINHKQISEVAWFFAWKLIKKILVEHSRIGRCHSGHMTLKVTALQLAVSQKLIDGMNYFACWCKFTSQSYFNDFWIGVVRRGYSHLVHEALKSAVSKEWVYELNWFFTCWWWGNNFKWRSTFYSISWTFQC